MRRPEQVKADLVRQWLAKADQDLHAAEALLAVSPPFLYPACFHAQQAAEKYLKALLTWHQVEFPKTHAIEQLLHLLSPVAPDVVSAVQEAADLTPYGVEVRYPSDEPEPDAPETLRSVELARRVREAVVPLLPGNV